MTRTMIVLVLLWVVATTARGQQDPPLPDSALNEAVRLVTEGQGEAARALVRQHLTTIGPSDTLFPVTVYAAGVVAADPDSATAYFRRVSVEYSTSPWAPAALVRLAQFAFAAADYRAVLRTTDRLRFDYPASPHRAAAAFWGGRAHLELDDLASGCALLRQAEVEAASEVELLNRVQFYLQRCPATVAAPAGSAAAGAATYAVQVAAVQSPLAADEVMRTLRARGHEPRVVRDADGLLKIRVGQFRTRPEAQRLLERLRGQVAGTPFIVEERP